MPIDEEALGKAMYIEYYLPTDGPGEGTNDPRWRRIGSGGTVKIPASMRMATSGSWIAGFPIGW